MSAMTSFGGSDELKAAFIERLDRACGAERAFRDRAALAEQAGSDAAVEAAGDRVELPWADPKAAATRYGLPMSLLGWMAAFKDHHQDPDAAYATLRRMIEAMPTGIDPTSIPSSLVVRMLEDRYVDAAASDIGGALLALHRREARGDLASREAWSEISARALAASDAAFAADGPGVTPITAMRLRLWEAAAWPARRSRSILADMARIWTDLDSADPDPDWSDEDETRKENLLQGLWIEFAPQREAGEYVDYPQIFFDRDPDLETRFEQHLNLVNGRAVRRWDQLADHCMDILSHADRLSTTA